MPALLLATLLAIGLLPFVVAAYGPQQIYQVKVTGPSRAVTCQKSVTLTATVVNNETGSRVRKQNVRWTIEDGARSDRLSDTQTSTNSQGRTSVDLYIGLALGNRKVKATASGSSGRVTVQVKCVLPTPAPTAAPTPTPRPTQRPSRTPQPTPRPTRQPNPPPTSAPTAPAVERTSLAVGYRETDLAGRAPLLMAQERGLFTEEGLDRVDLVAAPDGLSGLLDGSLDVAIVPLAEAIDAIVDGQPVVMLAAYQNHRPNVIAVRSGIEDVTGLDGQPIILGEGDERIDAATAALADAGWDLDGVSPQVVLPDGGPDAWNRAFLDGEVALTPILNRHRLGIGRSDATLLVDQQEFGDDVLLAREDLVADAPETTHAFLKGYLGGLAAIREPANDSDLFVVADSAGIDVSDAVIGGWPNDLEDFRPWDGGFGSADGTDGLEELQSHLLQRLGWLPPLADAIAWQPLDEAQTASGLVPNPVISSLTETPAASVRVGTGEDSLAARAPFLLAQATGAVEAAGLEELQLVATADGVGGVLDGSLDMAIVVQGDAVTAIDAGQAITIVAGYQDPRGGDATTVLVTRTDRATDDTATSTAILQAYLRGLAALNRADAFELVVAAGGEAVSEDVAAGFPAEVERYAPFDGGLSDDAPGAGPDLSALRAAQASLGLPVDQTT